MNILEHPIGQGRALGILSEERLYQDARWGDAPSAGKHSAAEFVLYMEHHIAEARRLASTLADPESVFKVMAEVRKIGALAIACMEQNGCPSRGEVWQEGPAA